MIIIIIDIMICIIYYYIIITKVKFSVVTIIIIIKCIQYMESNNVTSIDYHHYLPISPNHAHEYAGYNRSHYHY